MKYKQSSEDDAVREKEETKIINDLVIDGRRLLNCLRRYNPKETSAETEREKIKRFCDMLLRKESS